MKSKTVLLRVNIAGYKGPACTLFGNYDPDTDVLLIAQEAREYEPGPREGFLKLTNQDRDASYDGLFKDEEIRDAIRAFFDLETLRLVSFADKAQRCNPTSRIERLGLDDKGQQYSVHPDATNAQVAVLAASLWASRQRGFGVAMDIFDDMRVITI